jgi:hypothetical protein
MRRLVESWIKAEQSRGNNLAAAIRILNDLLGTKVTHSRLSEWKRGVYAPRQEVLSLMMLRTLPWALRQAGIEASDDQGKALVGLFWLTDEDRVEL